MKTTKQLIIKLKIYPRKIKFGFFAFAASIIFLGVAGCDSSSKQIEEAKTIAKKELIDGESAQFLELKYFKETNYVCGQINAKNRLGGYVGAKKFVVSLEQSAVEFDPDRKMPDAPSAPSYTSLQATIMYASQSMAWASEVDSIRRKSEAFDALVSDKCTSDPKPEKSKNSLPKQDKNPDKAFDINANNIPQDFKGAELRHISAKIREITMPKGETETTSEYKQRVSLISYDPAPSNFDDLYAFKISPAPFDVQENATYNADKERVSFSFTGALTSGLCSDSRNPKDKADYPIICDIGNGMKLAISKSNKAFGKYLKYQSGYFESDRQRINLEDGFRMPRSKVAEMPPRYESLPNKGLIISALLVGNLVDKQKNPQSTSGDFLSFEAIPFNLKHIIYYNSKNGEILIKRDIGK